MANDQNSQQSTGTCCGLWILFWIAIGVYSYIINNHIDIVQIIYIIVIIILVGIIAYKAYQIFKVDDSDQNRGNHNTFLSIFLIIIVIGAIIVPIVGLSSSNTIANGDLKNVIPSPTKIPTNTITNSPSKIPTTTNNLLSVTYTSKTSTTNSKTSTISTKSTLIHADKVWKYSPTVRVNSKDDYQIGDIIQRDQQSGSYDSNRAFVVKGSSNPSEQFASGNYLIQDIVRDRDYSEWYELSNANSISVSKTKIINEFPLKIGHADGILPRKQWVCSGEVPSLWIGEKCVDGDGRFEWVVEP